MPSRSERARAFHVATLGLCLAWLGGCTDALIEPIDGGQDTGRGDDGSIGGDGGDAGGGDGGDEGGGDAGSGGVMPDAFGQIVITEIMFDTDVVSDDNGEWIELHNPGGVTYDLDGCVLSDEGHFDFVEETFLIAPGAFATAARFPAASVGGFEPDFSYTNTKLSNDPGGDTVTLECDGKVIDDVDYSDFTRSKGHAMSLDPGSYDADTNDGPEAWCEAGDVYNDSGEEVDYGTPGQPNPEC